MKQISQTLLHGSILATLLTCSAFSYENSVKYSIALVGLSMDYREFDSANTLLDSETSTLGKISGYDMSLGYLFNKTDSSVDEVALNSSVLNGKSDYVGAVLGSGDAYGSSRQTTANNFIDASLSYKHTKRYKRIFDISYGLGVGYHAWLRELSSIQAELYSWYSLRPSISASVVINQFNVGISTEYQYGFNTQMSASNLSTDFKLGGVQTFVLGFPLRYNYRKNLEFFTLYTLSKQEIQKSNIVQSRGSSYYEPDSTSYQNSLKIGTTFKF